MTQDFQVTAIVKGFPIHAGHVLRGETRGDGATCYSSDGDGGSCG